MRSFSLVRGFLALTILGLSVTSQYVRAQALAFQNTYNLSSSLAVAASNFNPQGIGYDTSANELLFAQQSSQTLYRTDLTGNILGSKSVAAYNYTVSVAADSSFYYFSDYTSNTNGPDLLRMNKTTNVIQQVGSEIVAYGGYPIDVRNGSLYRAIPSTSYDYSNLNSIRVSNIATPDTTTTTLALNTPGGIADFAVDSANNSLWVMNYSTNASIYRYNLASGTLANTFPLNLNGQTGGMTFANNTLYYYNWKSGSGSTLSTYQFTPSAPATPEPGSIALLAGFAISSGMFLKRRKK